MTSLAKHVIAQTEWALRDYVLAVESVPADKEKWKPTPQSRHVLDLVQECGFVNMRWAAILRAQDWVEREENDLADYNAANATLERAIATLRETTQEFLEVVAGVPEQSYDKVIVTPWPGPWTEVTVGGAMLHAHYHLCYHEGQINYIATMCEAKHE